MQKKVRISGGALVSFDSVEAGIAYLQPPTLSVEQLGTKIGQARCSSSRCWSGVKGLVEYESIAFVSSVNKFMQTITTSLHKCPRLDRKDR